MLRHSRAQVRAARKRMICRRVFLWEQLDTLDNTWVRRYGGRWSKANGSCSCGMCRAEKYRDHRRTHRRRLDQLDDAAWWAHGSAV